MSSWADVHKADLNGGELKFIEAVQKKFAASRNLLQCLTGWTGDQKQQLTRCKVTLFYEMGTLKLCVTDDHNKRLGFTTLDVGYASIEEAVEQALGRGVEWRKRPEDWGASGRFARK